MFHHLLYNALTKFSFRTLRRSSKKLRDRGLLKLLPQVGVDSPRYFKYETYNMLIVMAKNLDVVDELNSRYVFEAQSFVDVHDSLLPSSLIAKELKLYSSELMRLPLDPPLTINGDVFSPQSDVEEDQFPESASMRTKDDFCATWVLR